MSAWIRRTTLFLGTLVGATALTGTPALAAGPFLTQVQATFQLTAVGVTWTSSGRCTDRNRPSCTSFDNIRSDTVTGIATLRTASGCAVNISGGTETGHSAGTYSHWNGYKADISHNSCIDGYITSRFKPLGTTGFGKRYQARSGNLYTDEGSHWDIVFYTCGCSG
jgi:hypothetical protein